MSILHDLTLGWQTDLIFARFDGIVTERPDCVVVRSPSNPLYYWGNCLLLPEPPRDAELAHWRQRFDDEIAALQPESAHVAIGFDAHAPHEPLLSWQDAGYEVFSTCALRLTPAQLRTPARVLPAGIEFKVLDLPIGMDAAVDLQCEVDEGQHNPASYREHRKRQMRRYQAMQDAGLGHWFSLRQGPAMVADCGLFRSGTLGRFQMVGTHPGWRRRGLCAGLIHAVSRYAFDTMGLTELVMCADPHDVAIDIYESLGFERVSRHWGAHLHPPALAGT
jgi:RimJ/RimL family protein N-acetyltransferase